MLHTKFRENRPAGSGDKIFEGFYHIWAWRPSWSCFIPPNSSRLYINLALIGRVVLEKKMFEIVNDDDGRWATTDDGRTPDHEYPISSPMSLWLR